MKGRGIDGTVLLLWPRGWTLMCISAIKKQSLSFIDEGALTSCLGLSTTGGGGRGETSGTGSRACTCISLGIYLFLDSCCSLVSICCGLLCIHKIGLV